MGHASVAFTELWSVQNNQAGLAYLENISTGIYYENRFLLKELSNSFFGFAFPSRFGTIALQLNYFGYSKYNESKIGLAYARKFGNILSFGIQLDYLNTKIGNDLGSRDIITFEAGAITQPVKNLRIGVHVFNPIRSKIADYNDERVPVILKMGMVYFFSDELILAIEAEKNIDYPINLKTGLEYGIKKSFFIRIGMNTNPTTFSMGFGCVLKQFKFDIASNYHQQLGFSPQLSIIYQFRK